MARFVKIRAAFLSGFSPSLYLRHTTRFSSIPNRRSSRLELRSFIGQHSKLFCSSSPLPSLSSPSPPSPLMAAVPRIKVLTEDDEDYPEYPWIEGVERLERYDTGGYHPVMIGDLLHQRYKIVDKLGFGGYSTIWLAQDTKLNRYVAVKVSVSSWLPHEIKALQVLSTPSPAHPGRAMVPSILDIFEVHGPNGTHSCYTTDIARCSLQRASSCCLFSLDVTRALVYGLTMAVAYTHSRGYVHGDINLQNILLKLPKFDDISIDQFYEEYGKPETATITRRKGKPLPPNLPPKAVVPLDLGKDAEKYSLAEAQIMLSDFGEAFTPASTIREGKDSHIHTCMRPPETRFEPHSPLSFSADIWSLAIAIWSIIGIKPLFGDEFNRPDQLVSQHIDALGPMPREWWNAWEKRSDWFLENGAPTEGREVWPPPLNEYFEMAVQRYRREDGIEFKDDEAAAILDILRRMLSFRPEERPTIEDVLNSEWMVKWGLPCFEQSLREQ